MNYINHQLKPVNKLVLTALLIALAIVINFFKIDLPIAGGAPALRISFGGPFLAFTALIGGPLYGAIAGGLIDYIGYILQPTGPYIPLLTVTAILKGALLGLFWKTLSAINTKVFNNIYILLCALIGIIGLVNTISVNLFPNGVLSQFILSIGNKSTYATFGFILVFIVGILLFCLIKIIANKYDTAFEKYMGILMVIGCSSIIITTINTYVLKIFMTALNSRAFILIWIPRIAETLLMIPIETYAVLSIIGVYNLFTLRSGIK